MLDFAQRRKVCVPQTLSSATGCVALRSLADAAAVCAASVGARCLHRPPRPLPAPGGITPLDAPGVRTQQHPFVQPRHCWRSVLGLLQGLIVSTVVPLALTLRFPALIFVALRGAFMVPLTILLYSPPQVRAAVLAMLWKHLAATATKAGEKAGRGAGARTRRK